MADSDVSDTDPVADGSSSTSSEPDTPTQTEAVAASVTEDETPPTEPVAPAPDPVTSKLNAMAESVDKILAAVSGLQATFVDTGGIVRDDFTPALPSAASGANTAQGQTQDAAGVNQTSEDTPLEELDFTL